MTKKIFLITTICTAVLVLGSLAFAVNPFEEIEYPIQELGWCQDRAECKEYCDVLENLSACLDFAVNAGLILEQDAEIARKMKGKTGPGGCEGMNECELYCENIDNIDECLAFAEENDILGSEELEEMRKISAALKRGIKPPCNSRRECDEICMKPEHIEECMAFAEAAGLMPEHEREEAKKFLQAIKDGAIPPDCNGPRECNIYCSQPENMQECMEFAIIAGFVDPEEAEDMKRSLEVMKLGIMPPDCRGREECDIFCSLPENVEQCMKFSVAAGYMTQEQADVFEKTGGKGPGGCVGEAQCHEFCGKPENTKDCLEFGVMMGEMTQEQADRIIQEMEQWKEERYQGGPGGCQTPEECEVYCKNPDNLEECSKFGPGDEDHGTGPGPDFGPPPQGIDGYDGNDVFRDGPRPEGDFEGQFDEEFEMQYDEEFQRQFDEGILNQFGPGPDGWEEEWKESWQEGTPPDQWYDTDGSFPPQGGEWQKPFESDEFHPELNITPQRINEIIYETEQNIREGITDRLEPDNIYPKEEWQDNPQPNEDSSWGTIGADDGQWTDTSGGDWVEPFPSPDYNAPEPTQEHAPTSESPQSLITPIKKFISSISDFLSK